MAKNKRDMPVGVKIIAILGFIGAVLALLFGILMMVGSAFLGSILTSLVPEYSKFSALGTMALVMIGILVIVFAGIAYFISRGLWDGKNWARIVTIIFSALSVLGSITSFDLVSLVVNGVIIWYLGFTKEVKKAFK